MSEADDIFAGLSQRRVQAQSQAIYSMDEDPQQAARALELEKTTGVPSEAIFGDVEGFEQQHKAVLSNSILKNNPVIADWINSHPLNAALANGDLGNLDEISQKAQTFKGHAVRNVATIMGNAAKAFWEEVNQPAVPLPERQEQYFEAYPFMKIFKSYVAAANQAYVGPIISGGLAALQEGVTTAATQVGIPRPDVLGRDVRGMAEEFMSRTMAEHAPALPEMTARQQVEKYFVKLNELYKAAEPYVNAGESPPPGVHPIIDEVHKQQAELDSKNLSELLSSVQKSNVHDIAPDKLAEFLRLEFGEKAISIDAEAVRKLYGDKPISPDDGLLGFIPDLERQLSAAEGRGGRVEAPLADWLAKIDPEVAKALRDDTASHGVLTKNEVENLRPVTDVTPRPEGEAPKAITSLAPPIDELDSVRRAAGVAELPGLTLQRVDEVYPGKVIHTFDINDPAGKRVGGVSINELHDGKELYISSITGGTKEGLPNIFGTGQMNRLVRQLQQEFPNAKEISGLRVSGARAGAPKSIKIPLRPTPKQLSDFISGWEVSEGMPRGRSLIPENAQVGRRIVTSDLDRNLVELNTIHQFTVGDILKKLDLTTISDSPLFQAFGGIVQKLAKDTLIHVIDNDSWREHFGDNAGLHQLFPDGKSHIILPEDIVNGREPEWLAAHVIVHEAAHSISVAQLYQFPKIAQQVKRLMDFVDNELSERDPTARKTHDYAFTNIREFIAESFSKEGFQNVLQNIRITDEIAKDLKLDKRFPTVWEQVKGIIRDLWTQILGKEPPVTAIDALFRIGEELEYANKVIEKMIAEGKPLFEHGFADPMLPKLDFMKREPEIPGLTRMEDRDAFENAAAQGMTATEYKIIKRRQAEKDAADMEHFHAQAERRAKEIATKEWKEGAARIRNEVKGQLVNRPDIAVDNFLREGDLWGTKIKGRPRLDGDKLTPEQRAGLPEDYVRSGGVDPRDVATNFGYQSVDAMLDHLKQLITDRGDAGPREHVNKLADRIVEERMRREYGNLQENILEETKDHVISKTQLDELDERVIALAQEHGNVKHVGEIPIAKEALEAWVKEKVKGMPISQLDKDDFLFTAGKADRAARNALDKPTEYLKFRQQQRVSLLMAREARAYEKERASFDELSKRFTNPRYAGMSNDFIAQIRGLLSRAGLMTGRTVGALAEDLAEAGDLLKFVKQESEAYQVPILLPDWMYTDWNKKLDSMSREEFGDYSKGVRQLYNFGRDQRSMDVQGMKMDLDHLKEKVEEQLQKRGKKEIKPPSTPKNLIGMAKNIFYGQLIQAHTIFNQWDFGEKRGLFNMLLTYPSAQASEAFSAAIKRYAGKISEIGEHIKGIDLNRRLPDLLSFEGRKIPMTYENAIRIITDMGNASNRDKFVRGWEVDPNILMSWLQRNTTKEDWDFAQKLGDIHAEIFTELKTMIREVGGVVPDQVELSPFTDPHGVKREGWYSPMIYNQVYLGKSRKAAGLPEVDPNTVTGLLDSGYFKATTATGAEIARTGYAGPTDLTLARLPQKMTQIMYDTAFRPFVINAGKLLRDPSFLNMVEKYHGEHVRDLVKAWYNDILGQGKGISTSSDIALGQVAEFLRRNIIGQLIGWNIHTVQKHSISALINSVGEVGVGNFAREFINLTRAPEDVTESNWNFAMEKSGELQRRRQNWTETLGGQFEQLRFGEKGYRAWRDWMLTKGSAPIAFFDLLSAVPTWLAEYKTQMVELAKERPGVDPASYEGTAIEVANAAVRRAHGSTAITSRPGAMRGGAFGRTFVSLYGFFNQVLQRNYEAMWRTKYAAENFKQGDYEKGKANLQRAAMLFVTSALAPALVEEMVTPYTNQDKDSWAKWTGKTLLNGMSATIPFAREIVHGFMNNWETGVGILDTGFKEAKSSFADLSHPSKAMDAEHGGKTLKDFNGLVGLLTGVTNNEVGNVMKTIWDITHKTKATPRTPSETYQALTSGRVVGEPDIIQRGIELAGQKGRRK